jgi:uncharacterized membrane protein
MHARKLKYNKSFLFVSALALIFVVTELVFQYYGTSICYTEGCKLVSQQVRFGDISILLIGLVTFALLTALSAKGLYGAKTDFGRYINIIMVASLASEGFFAGYQAFSLHRACLFCLVLFTLIVILGILRFLSGEREMLAGFASLATVFSLFYLIMPVGMTLSLPTENRLILFYSKECKHCAEIIKELEDRKITVTHLQAPEYAAFLKSMGIDKVPTLYVNDPYQKTLLTGTEAIRRYLIACTAPAKPTEKTKKKTSSGKADGPVKADKGNIDMPVDIFSQPGILNPPGETTPADGMCKEDEICK